MARTKVSIKARAQAGMIPRMREDDVVPDLLLCPVCLDVPQGGDCRLPRRPI
jgi:hypothetical protein